MINLRIGVIAEDDTDCMTLDILIRRLLPNHRPGIPRRARNGCGQLDRKASAWFREMARDGCQAVIHLRDLDRDPANNQINNEAMLRNRLIAIPIPSELRRLICIPIEELEAWFWADTALIREIGDGRGKASSRPDLIQKPKEALVRLSRDKETKKALYSTNDNPDLAKKLDLNRCAACCPAFRELRDFVINLAEEVALSA
jgi:hypothetical protein